MLTEAEQRLFARLAVFVGGCTLEASEAVCNPDGALDVLGGVESLLEKSLLQQKEGVGGEPRFVMLETIHEYARERLETSGEAETVRARHTTYFLDLVKGAEPHLRGAQQLVWGERLEEEHANLRAVLSWALDRGDPETAARLGGMLWWFWLAHGHRTEGRRWLEAALADRARVSASSRAKALSGAGRLAWEQGDCARGTALAEESVALFRELGDALGLADAVGNLGVAAVFQGDLDRAQTLFEECLALFRETANQWGIGGALNDLGLVARFQGDYG